ncbi:20557_t:CDS:2, partial [Gigaspora margarita]
MKSGRLREELDKNKNGIERMKKAGQKGSTITLYWISAGGRTIRIDVRRKESEKAKKGRKKNKTHDNRLKNENMVNESQVPIMELKHAELKKNRVQEALTDSSSLNTSWADNTEATYGKGGSLGQSKLIENSFLSSSGRSEDLMVDQIEGSRTNPDNVMSDIGSEEQQINRRKGKTGITKYKQGQRKEGSNLENTSLNTNNNSDKAAETTKESEDSRKMNSEGKEGENLQEKKQENNNTEDQEMIEA